MSADTSTDDLRELASDLWYWMNERHRIYTLRGAGQPWPWTEDPVLRNWRFCNVYRELDTVTRWIHTHIRRPYQFHEDLPFMLCIARTFNWPPTLQLLMDAGFWPDKGEWAWEEAARFLDDQKEYGAKIYTGAYMIRAESNPANHWYIWSKQKYVTGIVLNEVWKQRKEWPDAWLANSPKGHLELASDWLQQFHGWGPFMAYEVITDMRHTQLLCEAEDIMTWANPGPGANRGLNRIMRVKDQGYTINWLRPKEEAIELMRRLLEIANDPNDTPLGPHMYLPLEMRDIEHSLCEMDKYVRTKNCEGTSRSRYIPATETSD